MLENELKKFHFSTTSVEGRSSEGCLADREKSELDDLLADLARGIFVR